MSHQRQPDGRTRVTHIITEAHPMGGAQYNTFYSLREQQKVHAVELIVGNNGPLVELCRTHNIPVTVMPFRNRLIDPVGDAHLLVRLITHLWATRPDVVHTHSSKAGILGRLAARLARVPAIIHTIHGHEWHAGYAPAVQRTIILVQRAWQHLTDGFVAVSNHVRDEWIAAGICTPDQIRTIVSGIDFDSFPSYPWDQRAHTRDALGVPPDTCLIVCMGNFLRDKGYDVLLDVAETVVRSEPTVLFGILGGWGEVHEWVQSEIVRRGLEHHIVMWGLRPDVPQILASADIYVQTSRREALSRGLVEAMFSRLAIVASDVGGTTEVMHDGETGYVVPSGDALAMANSILYLARNPDVRRRMGDRAYDEVAESRSVHAMVHALEELYAELLRRKSRRGAEGIQRSASPRKATCRK